MVYLDSAATSLLKPKEVSFAVSRAMATMASPGRGCHKPAMLAADTVLDCRMLLASYFNIAEPENVIFTCNATHALNIAINSLVSLGDTVVISGYEHNAVTRPLRALNADVRIAYSNLFDENQTIEAFRQALPGAKCAICTHVSNVYGFILPIYEISKLCHALRIPLIIDASQSAGTLPVDFTSLDADFIAMPGHKGLMGPQGTGVLLVNHEARPILFGGTGSNSADSYMPNFLPDRLEAGTHNVAGIAGLAQGIKYVMSKPDGTILSHEKKLCTELARRLVQINGMQVFYDYSQINQSGVLSVVSDRISSDELAERLGKADICVRAGLHCAPTAHETVGTVESGTVRFSFSPFNTMSDVSFTAETVKKIMNNV